MADPDAREEAPWRVVAIATMVGGAAVVFGPRPSATTVIAVAALASIGGVVYALTRPPAPDASGWHAVDPWIVLCNCPNVQAAFFVRAALEGSQIEAFIPDEHVANMRSELVTAIGGVRVWVRLSDFDRASDLLNSTAPQEAHDDRR